MPIPKIGDHDVLMKVTYCGVCGSDLHIETWVHDCDAPVVLGHEYTGVVAEVGAGVTQFRAGDPVSYYRAPNPFPGVIADGGFAEYMRLPAASLWKTPDGVTPEEATQFETILPPIEAVRGVAQLRPGERVVVTGPGQIGLLITNIARIAGASHITALGGPDDEAVRLPLAKEFGADEGLPFGEEALATLKGNNAPAVWFEASGAAPAIEAAVDHVAQRGRIVITGIGSGPWNVNMWCVARHSLRVLGLWGGNHAALEQAVEWIRAGKLDMSATIGGVMPLTEWQEAFSKRRRKEAVKILLDPSR
ncbi:MAG: alcohol dehydrogenase catalytic domain-containing protein [Candidatus Poribacteria bacterium]